MRSICNTTGIAEEFDVSRQFVAKWQDCDEDDPSVLWKHGAGKGQPLKLPTQAQQDNRRAACSFWKALLLVKVSIVDKTIKIHVHNRLIIRNLSRKNLHP